MIKEVTVFANGDSRQIKVWSNVPYFFTETLLARGIKVNRVDLSEGRRKKNLFDERAMPLVKRVRPQTTYTYFRSFIHFHDNRRKIKKALAAHPDADANIFLTYSFSSAGFSKKPTVLFCDWTYEYYLGHFCGKTPDLFERASIRRENRQMQKADLIISLFPRVAAALKKRYQLEKICYLGNVVNALAQPDEAVILKTKATSREILFIGSRHYLAGANLIISAFRVLKKQYPDLKLNIVGLTEKEFADLPPGVNCHGYLDKSRSDHKEIFYTLMQQARVFVNTTPKWGAFSAMLEALFFYVPVITTPYCECVETFGEELNFGEYCRDGTVETLQAKIKFILETPTYETLCRNAHDSVKDFSWPVYIDKVLQKIDQTIENQ